MLISNIQHAGSSRALQAAAMLFGLILSTLASAADAQKTYGEMDGAAFDKAARKTYALQDFSDHYRATVEVAAADETFRPGVITVYGKASDKLLIRVQSNELVLDPDAKSGKIKANVQELPYGEQSVLIYNDFNFDGIKDLALMDGQNSCYRGPSFQVFLGTANGFKHSDSFTKLAQNNCGMFAVDEKKHQISTMTKDGCCWHQTATYSIRGGEPVMETETITEQTGASGVPTQTVGMNKNGKMVRTTSMLWKKNDQRETLLSFKLAPAGKRVILFRSGAGSPVFYAAVNTKDQVGLLYPQADAERFEYDAASNALSFVRGDTTYRIQGDAKGAPKSMHVVARGKATDLKLLAEPAQGSLEKVAEAIKASAQ
ncbi:XAC2610-related protein [Pseudomonas syringae group genomosp. 3]|nr:hypothetical protein [Pseudomonas syringae group genomosp. 3]KKI23534.1 hypothetical protein WX98_24515 [Pseudomonas syringae pv. persicae]KPC16189.1 Uncharacterized protein AC506_0347 [Pseudomonas syringae pv. maculicola str. M6]MBF9246929.1 hypothetical protein [Pseudomonas syringae pv. tomato]